MPYGHAARTEFGVRSSEFGVRSLEFGVRSSEFGVRSMPYGHAARTEFGVRSSVQRITEITVKSSILIPEYIEQLMESEKCCHMP